MTIGLPCPISHPLRIHIITALSDTLQANDFSWFSPSLYFLNSFISLRPWKRRQMVQRPVHNKRISVPAAKITISPNRCHYTRRCSWGAIHSSNFFRHKYLPSTSQFWYNALKAGWPIDQECVCSRSHISDLWDADRHPRYPRVEHWTWLANLLLYTHPQIRSLENRCGRTESVNMLRLS